MLKGRVLAACAVLAVAVTGCTGDDDGDDGDAELVEPTFAPEVVDLRPTIETIASHDPDFLPSVLADNQVTAEELSTAYERFVECLAEGGAYGTYSYDVELHATLALDYQVAGDDGLSNYSSSLRAGCSRDFLDRLSERYYTANPDTDEIAERQHDSIVECVSAVDPTAAAAVPGEVTTDSLAPGFYLSGTLDLSELTDNPDQLPALERCFYSIGAEWKPFGTPPADDEATPTATT